METVRIFDTTLRDGEQSPGATLTLRKNWKSPAISNSWAWISSRPGFPSARPAISNRSRAIAAEVTLQHGLRPGPVHGQGRRAGRRGASKHAKHSRIHVFCATSKIHREHKLRRARRRSSGISVESIKHGPRSTPTMWSFRRKMPAGRSWNFWKKSCRPPSRPAHDRSTCRTRSATPRRRPTARFSRT